MPSFSSLFSVHVTFNLNGKNVSGICNLIDKIFHFGKHHPKDQVFQNAAEHLFVKDKQDVNTILWSSAHWWLWFLQVKYGASSSSLRVLMYVPWSQSGVSGVYTSCKSSCDATALNLADAQHLPLAYLISVPFGWLSCNASLLHLHRAAPRNIQRAHSFWMLRTWLERTSFHQQRSSNYAVWPTCFHAVFWRIRICNDQKNTPMINTAKRPIA